MTIHREGHKYLLLAIILLLGALLACYLSCNWFTSFLAILVGVYFLFCLQFFRYPFRTDPNVEDNTIISPADGQVVVIERLNSEIRQVSIFMSPLNVHANWIPVKGKITRSEIFKGKYLVAWHPKSSSENERHEVDILFNARTKITVKQIAGAVARRIVCYAKVNDKVERSDKLGFIKFGSRVDLLLPNHVEILVNVNEHVVGNKTMIGRIN